MPATRPHLQAPSWGAQRPRRARWFLWMLREQALSCLRRSLLAGVPAPGVSHINRAERLILTHSPQYRFCRISTEHKLLLKVQRPCPMTGGRREAFICWARSRNDRDAQKTKKLILRSHLVACGIINRRRRFLLNHVLLGRGRLHLFTCIGRRRRGRGRGWQRRHRTWCLCRGWWLRFLCDCRNLRGRQIWLAIRMRRLGCVRLSRRRLCLRRGGGIPWPLLGVSLLSVLLLLRVWKAVVPWVRWRRGVTRVLLRMAVVVVVPSVVARPLRSLLVGNGGVWA